MCQVTSSRRIASDLTQQGLEVSVVLFEVCRRKGVVDKTKTIVTPSPCPGSTELMVGLNSQGVQLAILL